MWRAARPPSTRPSTAIDMKILDRSHPLGRPARSRRCSAASSASRARPGRRRSAPTQAAALRSEFGSADTALARAAGSRIEARARPDDAQTERAARARVRPARPRDGRRGFLLARGRRTAAGTRARARNVYALTGLGGIALARHRFARCAPDRARTRRRRRRVPQRRSASSATRSSSSAATAPAFATFDRMVALKPNASSYSRVSYARELRGDVDGAIEAMELALDAVDRPARGRRRGSRVELGKLALVGRASRGECLALPLCASGRSRLRAGARRPRPRRGGARQREPGDRAPAARGRVDPAAGHVAQLGDLLASAGRTGEAREQYALVGSIERLQVANGVKVDLETALYRVDHGIRLRDSLSLARRPRRERPSIHGDDVLAWALARNGRCAEALVHSKRSLRLGTRDATFSSTAG